MKTVMKKMFCLLLVAVMLVSAVPAAFADVADTVACTDPTHTDCVGVYVNTTVEPTCAAAGTAIYHCNAPAGIPAHDFEVTIPKLGHSWTAEVKKAATCSETGLKVHTCVRGCTENETLAIDPNNHTFSGGICTGCGICENCKQATCVCCPDCGSATGHTATCPTLLCDKNCGREIHTGYCCTNCNAYGHQLSSCDKLYETCCGVQKNTEHRPDCVTNCTGDRDCTNANHATGCEYALCDTAGCTKNDGHTGEHTGVPCRDANCNKALNHDGKHSYECPTIGCDKVVGHSGNCSNDPVEIPGDSDLHIFVNLYTADTLTKTVHLKSYEDISSATLIYDFIADHRNELNNELAKDGYPGYEWSGHVYDKDNKGKAVGMNAKVGEGATVHINAYTAEDMVWIYVHNSRTMDPIRIIQLRGKKSGETVTKSEVTKAVSKYYNVSSLAMYSEAAWEDYVDGKKVDSVSSLKISEDDSYYIIDVKISGTAKASSGSATADSTNPKTGDAIYAPVMVLGASASALAVLFYLNKKRAF